MGLFYVLYQTILVLPLIYVSQLLWKFYTPIDDKQNMLSTKLSPTGVVYFAYILSIALITSISFMGEGSHSLMWDTYMITSTYLIANVLLMGVIIFINKFFDWKTKTKNYIFSQLTSTNSNDNSYSNGNMSFGIILMAIMLSIAIQFVVSNIHKDLSMEYILNIAIPYFIFGQILIFGALFFLKIKTKYDDFKELSNNNIAVAIYFGSILICASLLIGNVIQQTNAISFTNLKLVFIYSFFSLIFIILIPEMVTKVLLSLNKVTLSVEEQIQQNNMNVSLVVSAIRVVFTMIVLFSMPFDLI